MDLHLRFETEEEANSLLFTFMQGDKIFPEYKLNKFMNTDVIGYQYKTVLDENGEEVLVTDGFLVNIRPTQDEDISSIEPYNIVVNSPMRVWA